tara:strand:+ start:975 stop:1259 length:285 start_codon:yes stop_codon:yes gene_type:complete
MYNENFKFYKLKRPKEGYNSEKERNMNSWSGVSDWELFYKDKYIGTIYYVGTSLVEWAGYLELDNAERIKAFPSNTRREVFEQLCSYHYERLGE